MSEQLNAECAALLETVLGLRLSGEQGMPLADFIPADLAAKCRDAIERARGEGKPKPVTFDEKIMCAVEHYNSVMSGARK